MLGIKLGCGLCVPCIGRQDGAYLFSVAIRVFQSIRSIDVSILYAEGPRFFVRFIVILHHMLRALKKVVLGKVVFGRLPTFGLSGDTRLSMRNTSRAVHHVRLPKSLIFANAFFLAKNRTRKIPGAFSVVIARLEYCGISHGIRYLVKKIVSFLPLPPCTDTAIPSYRIVSVPLKNQGFPQQSAAHRAIGVVLYVVH